MSDDETEPRIDLLLGANRANWDERTTVHLEAYPVQAFRAGESTLRGTPRAGSRSLPLMPNSSIASAMPPPSSTSGRMTSSAPTVASRSTSRR